LNLLREEPDGVVGGIKISAIIKNVVYGGEREVETIYTGNINSAVLPRGQKVVEIQHGALDASYFSGRAPSKFLARSQSSACIYGSRRPGVEIAIVSNDLAPPRIEPVRISVPTNPWFFSKNPGGGIERKELACLERSLCGIFPDLCLFLHPRDNVVKLFFRHGFSVCVFRAYLRNSLRSEGKANKLIISSYSTALFDKASSNDFVLNVADRVSECSIRTSVYSDVPFLTTAELISNPRGTIEVGKVQ